MFGRKAKKLLESEWQDDNNILKWWNEGQDLILSNGPVIWKPQSDANWTMKQNKKPKNGDIQEPHPAKTSKDDNLILFTSPSDLTGKRGIFMAFYGEQYLGAEDRVRELCYTKARKKYGETLPDKIANRLKKEMEDIERFGWWSCLYFAYIITDVCRSHGYPCKSICKETYLTGYLMGISEINPLMPHYYCPQCKQVEWVEGRETLSGYDLIAYGNPTKKCENCGGNLEGDGQNIRYGYPTNGFVPISVNIPEQALEAVFTRLDEVVGNKNLDRSGYDRDRYVPKNPVAHLNVDTTDEMSALCMMGELSGITPETIRVCDTDILSFMDEKDFDLITRLYSNDHRFGVGRKFLWDFINEVKPEKFSDLVRVFYKFQRVRSLVLDMDELPDKEMDSGFVDTKEIRPGFVDPGYIADAMILMKYIWYGRNCPEAFDKALKEHTKNSERRIPENIFEEVNKELLSYAYGRRIK